MHAVLQEVANFGMGQDFLNMQPSDFIEDFNYCALAANM